MSEQQLCKINDKLDQLILLFAAQAVSHLDAQKDKISFLSEAGIAPKDIAKILGTTSNTVSVTLSNLKKKK